MNNQETHTNFWQDAELICSYSRQDAIEDGELIEVSDTAKSVGIIFPTCVTRAVWTAIENIPPRFQGIQTVEARLWDVLYMLSLKIKLLQKTGMESNTIHYSLIMQHGRHTYCQLKAICGPGDTPAPVITIMLPDED